jgi:hypothetical protein
MPGARWRGSADRMRQLGRIQEADSVTAYKLVSGLTEGGDGR